VGTTEYYYREALDCLEWVINNSPRQKNI
jgi:hypothetical protein